MNTKLTIVRQLLRGKKLMILVPGLFLCETISVVNTPVPTESFTTIEMKQARKVASSHKRKLQCFRATNYYLPDQDTEPRFKGCRKTERIRVGKTRISVCPKFWAAVKMQGSGHLTIRGKKHKLHYTGRLEPVKSTKCSTAIGAANKCLIPFVHVAADPAYYNMGDIIEVPALKYMRIPRADGKGEFIHPGYFIVGDTGGAIKGFNRFDFFTGKVDPLTQDNPFGPWGKKMTDERHCVMGFKRISKKANPRKVQRLARAVLGSATGTRDVASRK